MGRRRFSAGRFGAVCGLALLVTGCYWTMPGQGPNRQAHNEAEDDIGVDTVAGLTERWAASVDAGTVGDPVTSTAGVVVNDASSVYTFAPATGAEVWQYSRPAPDEMLQPLVRGDQVWASWWRSTTTGSPDQFDKNVALGVGDGAAAGAPADGVPVGLRGNAYLRWSLGYFPTPRGDFWSSHVAYDDGAGVVCCDGPIGLNGISAPPPPPERNASITTDEHIYLSGEGPLDSTGTNVGNGLRGVWTESPVLCFGLYTCPTWAVTLDGNTSTPPVLSDDEQTVYVGTDAGTLFAVQIAGEGAARTASVRWSVAVGPVTDSPALANGSLFVPTAAGDLVVVDEQTGSVLWTAPTASEITQQPAVAGGVVFLGSANGVVRAYDAAGCGSETCSWLWAAATGSRITGAPAVSQGQLYVGTEDGRLIAFGL